MKQLAAITPSAPATRPTDIAAALPERELEQRAAKLSQVRPWITNRHIRDIARDAGVWIETRLDRSVEIHGTTEARLQVLEKVRRSLTPFSRRQIEQRLARLSVLVARRAHDDDALRLLEYANRLTAYPADLVEQVLVREVHEFWPTWREIEASLGPEFRERLAMIEALSQPEEPALESEVITPEQREAIMREYFGGEDG